MHLTGLVLDVLAQDPDDLGMESRDPAVARFGAKVRAARQARGWTQEELAERSGMAAVQISRVERGVREVRLTTLLRLARALRTTPGHLLDDLP
jgi:ribosome-binding protein aMBF1 (putative translation factor)